VVGVIISDIRQGGQTDCVLCKVRPKTEARAFITEPVRVFCEAGDETKETVEYRARNAKEQTQVTLFRQGNYSLFCSKKNE